MEIIKLLVVGLLGLSSFVSSATDLPLVNVGDKQLYYHTVPMNWFEASQFCSLHQLRLITIKTALENFYISEFLRSNQAVGSTWTSGTDLAKEGAWMWMSTGQSFTFNNFIAPQPDNNNNGNECVTEDCLALTFTGPVKCMYWIDSQCTVKYRFLCETKI